MADTILQTSPPPTTLPGLAVGTVDDCWRRIGTGGDRSCPQLATCQRCRNCPVYAQAAVAVLDSLAARDLAESAAFSAEPDEASDIDRRAELSLAVFRVGDEWLALPTAALAEITAPAPIHTLPHRRHAALVGVAAVRGTLLTCVSLALLFGASRDDAGTDSQRTARFLILGQGRNAMALPVAEVAGVERVSSSALLPLPATLARASARYTQALFVHGHRSVGLLDAGLLQHALSRSLA